MIPPKSPRKPLDRIGPHYVSSLLCLLFLNLKLKPMFLKLKPFWGLKRYHIELLLFCSSNLWLAESGSKENFFQKNIRALLMRSFFNCPFLPWFYAAHCYVSREDRITWQKLSIRTEQNFLMGARGAINQPIARNCHIQKHAFFPLDQQKTSYEVIKISIQNRV